MPMNMKSLNDLFKEASQTTGEPNRNIVEAIQREILAGNAKYNKDADEETIQVIVCLSHHPDSKDFIEATKAFEEVGAVLEIHSDPYLTIDTNENDDSRKWVYRLACTISRKTNKSKKVSLDEIFKKETKDSTKQHSFIEVFNYRVYDDEVHLLEQRKLANVIKAELSEDGIFSAWTRDLDGFEKYHNIFQVIGSKSINIHNNLWVFVNFSQHTVCVIRYNK